jgi:glycosyltransferase involved in cell wall biosynthesis
MSGIFPKVTVYLVNHNYGKYVREAIESVLNQSFQDFELIIIDNGSEDDSLQIIEQYTHHDKVLTIFQENIGLNRTNNVAIEMATGRYIMRLDADDYLHSNALELLAGALDRWSDVGLVFPDYFLVDDKGEMLDVVQRHDFSEVTLLDQPAHGACTMIRRECLEALDGYDESYHCQDGWDLWVRFIRRYGVRNVDLPLFYYRQHPTSLTKNEGRILRTRAKILQKAAVTDSALQSVAVIPIRGPEIDPRSIALRELAGKPVIEWTIDAALSARRVSEVIVTSSDRSIEQHVKKRYGNQILFVSRDWQLALPSKPLDDTLTALFETVAGQGIDFSAITLLFIESPFRGAEHIDAAVDAMDVFGCNRVIGVRHLNHQLFNHNGGGLVPLRNSKMLKPENREVYRAAGDLMVIRRGHLYRDTDLDEQVGHLEVDEYAAHRIFSEWSWTVAENCAERLLKNNKRQKEQQEG